MNDEWTVLNNVWWMNGGWWMKNAWWMMHDKCMISNMHDACWMKYARWMLNEFCMKDHEWWTMMMTAMIDWWRINDPKWKTYKQKHAPCHKKKIIKSYSSWWLNQPIWKICSSNWTSSPIFGVNIKKCLKPPASLPCRRPDNVPQEGFLLFVWEAIFEIKYPGKSLLP